MDKINKIKLYMAKLGWKVEEKIQNDKWNNTTSYFIKFSRVDWHGKFTVSLTGHAVYFTGTTQNAFDYNTVLNTVHHTAKAARKAWHEYKTSIPFQSAKGETLEDIMIYPWSEGRNIPKTTNKKHKIIKQGT